MRYAAEYKGKYLYRPANRGYGRAREMVDSLQGATLWFDVGSTKKAVRCAQEDGTIPKSAEVNIVGVQLTSGSVVDTVEPERCPDCGRVKCTEADLERWWAGRDDPTQLDAEGYYNPEWAKPLCWTLRDVRPCPYKWLKTQPKEDQ